MRGDRLFAEIASRPPFTRLHPKVAAFLKDYLSNEKVVLFGDRYVVNTHFPPFPSPAFDNLVAQFGGIGSAAAGGLYSVTLAVTNRCTFDCWHCYNAGRSQTDVPLDILRGLIARLQAKGAVRVMLTGGEPLLRDDLEEIAAAFEPTTSLLLGTTGDGLTLQRARRLRASGVFAAGISLDSDLEAEHDASRRRPGAFRIALDAIRTAGEAGLYPYVVTVANRELLRPERFPPFLRFAGQCGALEVHLLEPSMTGNLAGRDDAALSAEDRRAILGYQRDVAVDEGLPILSTFTYLEGPDAFGCGAGLTHLYIDGSGEVCPCNLIPLSFGSILADPLDRILERMRLYFQQPRTACAGRLLAAHIPAGPLPAPPDVSCDLCAKKIPAKHPLPLFFRVRAEARGEVGREELRAAYDSVGMEYDRFWLTEAAGPIDDLVEEIGFDGTERVFEAGCGTGYATALLARRARTVVAADLSEGMLARARERLAREGAANVRLCARDALEALREEGRFDVVFSSWVLGYIPIAPFFAAAGAALRTGGRLAFVVHREDSPREPIEIFHRIVARDPAVLTKRVAFDFPRDAEHVRREIASAGLCVRAVQEGSIVFRFHSPEEVLEHLLKSGAGTAFYEAVAEERRRALTEEFLLLFAQRRGPLGTYDVVHDYVTCVAAKP